MAYRYMSVSECIRANGDRHAENAQKHLADGHPDYAAGSMRKAERNWKRAEEMDSLFPISRNALLRRLVRSAEEKMMNGIAKDLFGG